MFQKKYLAIILIVMASLSSLFAKGDAPRTGSIEIEGSNNTVCIIDGVPERVVSLAPSITETIFALEKGDLLVGRTDYCDYPAEVSNVDSIGSLREPNIERIIELEPDLVVVSTHFSEENYNMLVDLGIPVLSLYDASEMSSTYDQIEKLGLALDAENKADEIVSDMKARIRAVVDTVRDADKPVVYYVIGFGEYGDYTAGGDTFISQLLNMAGGVNAAQELEGWKYSLEELIMQDPDIIICSKFWGAKDSLEAANGYMDLTAVKEGRLYEFDNNLLDRSGPRIADGVEQLAKIFHPDLF